MRDQLEGSQAVARAVARCRPEVVSAYPISPQTHIVEALSDMVRTGELAPCEYLLVESEFGAMSAAIGASAAGARAYTATASQGLLYMAEALFNASGLGLPIVMTVAATDLAREHLGRPLPNAALLGGFAALTGVVSVESVANAIRERFSGRTAEGNVAAALAAAEAVREGRVVRA